MDGRSAAAVGFARARVLLIALAVCAGAAILATVFASKVAAKMPDLEVYWTAAARARAAEPLYLAEDLHYQFKYLPAFAVIAIPLAVMPLEVAKLVWCATLLALVAAVLSLSLSVLPERRRSRWVLVTVTFVAMAKFYGHEIVLGQMNLLFAALVIMAIVALRQSRETRAGLLVAAAIVVKPYGVIFLPWLIARRQIPSIGAAAVGVGAVLALPAWLYGTSGNIALHRDWWTTVTESTAPNLTNPDNVSIAAMFAKWLGTGSVAATLSALTGVLLLTLAAVVFARRAGLPSPEGLEGSLLLTCVPLLSPQGWDYVFLVSTPAIMYLANYGDRLARPWQGAAAIAVATIGLSLFDLMGRASYAAFMRMSIISVCYLVVIGALAELRFRRIA